MTRLRNLLLVPSLVAASACGDAQHWCYVHCWDYHMDHASIQDSNSDGYYDSTCTNYHGGATMNAPLPTTAIPARECLPPNGQTAHEDIKAAIAAKLGEDLESLTMSQVETYEDFIDGVVDEVVKTCSALLTCNEQYCDIDQGMPGMQACTMPSARSLCETYVENLALDTLDLNTGADVPEYGVPNPNYYHYGVTVCDYVPESTGTGGETGGLDETGTAQSNPFGDVEMLIDCAPQTECTVAQALADNIKTHFSIFFDEGVELELGSWPEGNGARVSGLSSGDYSKEIADEFDIRNNDVVTHINGTALTTMSAEALANTLLDLHYNGYFELTVERRGSSTLTYEIRLLPELPPPPT